MDHQGVLRELSRLSVVRDEYCSQEMTDNIIHYIYDNHPDLILKIAEDEYPNRVGIHYDAYAKAVNAPKGHIEMPEHDLGLIDLAYELSRRVRIAYGMEEIPVKGRPLAPSIDGPYPELISKPIGEYTQRDGFEQEEVDSILDDFYKANDALCYIYSEQYRHDQNLLVCTSSYFRNALSKDKVSKAHRISRELFARLHEMCEMPKVEW